MSPREHRLRLAAILAADAVAYSRLMSVDARETIELLDAARKTFQTISIQNAGRVVGTPGDFVLALFKTAAGATAAALAIQHELETRAGGVEKNRRLRFRVGLHLGDVVQTADGSVYGDGVNVAARLQSLAPAGGIVASESIQLAVRGKVAADFVDLGDQTLKNIAGPVRAYRVVVSGQGSGALATSFEATTRIDSPPTPLSVLVLPFANQSNDDKTNYIADALTMSITADLSRIRDAFVVPAMNALTYRTKALTVQQVANDAGVRFVLHGSVLASGQRLRVTAHLLDSKTGAQLWSERFMGDLSDLFALQDEVTARVGNSIGEHMVIVAAREVETRKSGAQVTDLLLRARALNFRPYSTENLVERERLYREALSLEPNNVNAMIGLAIALAIHSQWLDNSDASRGKRLSDARDMALRVRAIDPCLRGIELPLYLYAQEHNDFDGARRALEAALAKDSKDPSAYGNFALFHLNMGEPERALPLLKQALSLYPKGNEFIFANLGRAALALGNDDAAIEWLLKAVDLDTQMWEVYSGLAMAYSNKGDRKRASRYIAEYEKCAAAQGIGGIEGNAPSPDSPPAFLRYYYEQFLPQWKKAGLP